MGDRPGFWVYFLRTVGLFLMWMMTVSELTGEAPSLWSVAAFVVGASMWVQSGMVGQGEDE
jgi:hypothetical protein